MTQRMHGWQWSIASTLVWRRRGMSQAPHEERRARLELPLDEVMQPLQKPAGQ